MPSHAPPLRDMHFVVHELFDAVRELSALPPYADLDTETINAVLEEAARFAKEVVFPLNLRCDTQGCTFDQQARNVALAPRCTRARRGTNGAFGVKAPIGVDTDRLRCKASWSSREAFNCSYNWKEWGFADLP